MFVSGLKNVFICGVFNAPHQELNFTYKNENGEKIVETIENANFKLLNNGFHTDQLHLGDHRSMLYLDFADQPAFKILDSFYVSNDLVTTAQPLNPPL